MSSHLCDKNLFILKELIFNPKFIDEVNRFLEDLSINKKYFEDPQIQNVLAISLEQFNVFKQFLLIRMKTIIYLLINPMSHEPIENRRLISVIFVTDG